MKPVAISVTELNNYIKEKVADDEYLNYVYVKGEISNFKYHYTGHMYFTLKDDKSLIKCVMFKGATATLNFTPKDGMKVFVFGTVSVYERDGIYQIYCKAMQEDGIGSLYKAYEELKLKLENEGLFNLEYKKKIPFMPKTIGVLTSETGAVIKDIINVSTRRNPNVNIKLFPIPVQGTGAAEKIVKALEYMDENKIADVLILARGGGSLEDLWPFNEENVARAIFEAKTPIISAVGHETDYTIADFVSDLRAPTPSAAAELAVPNISEIEMKLKNIEIRLSNSLNKKLQISKLKYEKIKNSKVFKDPLQKINNNYILMDDMMKRITNSTLIKIKDSKIKLVDKISKLDSLSPLKTLSRGYSIIELDGKIIKSINDIKTKDEININLYDGKVKAEIM